MAPAAVRAGGVVVRRSDQIGRHQGRVLTILVTMHPRPVDARWLAYVADPAGDQTRGARVLATLEARGYIARNDISRSIDRLAVLKWRITRDGAAAWSAWLPSLMDETDGFVLPTRTTGLDESGEPVVAHG